MILETAGILLLAVPAFIVAVWLHELTHAAAVVLLGGTLVEIDLFNLHVDFKFDKVDWRYSAVWLAPAIVGLGLAPGLAMLWSGRLTATTMIVAVCWTLYTLNGGTQGELSLAPRRQSDKHAQ